MKFIRLATIAALSTTILAGGTAAVFADENTEVDNERKEVRTVPTEGQVEFRPVTDEGEDLEIVTPEPEPEIEIDPLIPTVGPLSILMAPTMNFGTQVISNTAKEYNMVAEMQQKAGTEGEENKVPYVSFAQVHDIRGTNDGWDLKVSMSEFESNTQNNILTGAEIVFVGSRIQYEGSNKANTPEGHADGLKLSATSGAQTVMTAEQGKGAGVSSVVWGNQDELTKQFQDPNFDPEKDVIENGAIQLHVPGTTAKDATTYKATLTWDLTTTPGNTTPEN
ncbi:MULTISPECIES: WxL domain-containing protein [Enterococcus]|uniref:WxL domain-containing protein n=1 Tax=Enterococcus entomosocium TaxID=3034352 RepID=A0ABV3MDV5_9ENTE|nr:WxL domain-containing protein [Enterococcus casseliflavus]MDB1710374.1 WxL domain-containing protein [Enterococcus casseliflavus]MDB1717855.1 WxL domain-containing protein [Enterococcus casseliflavus]